MYIILFQILCTYAEFPLERMSFHWWSCLEKARTKLNTKWAISYQQQSCQQIMLEEKHEVWFEIFRGLYY